MSGRLPPANPAGAGATSWDTFSPARPYQPLWISLGVLFLLPGLVLTYLRLVPPTDDVPALVASFISYAVLAYAVALVCFLVALVRARRRSVLAVLAAVSAGLLACHAWWLAPLFVADSRPATTRSFSVMSLNLHNGGADPAQVADRASHADVVVLLEATAGNVQDLSRHGWQERFPYAVGRPDSAVGETLIFSRFPVSEQSSVASFQFQQWIATVSVPDLGPVRVLGAHPCNPYCGHNLWYAEHQQLVDVALANTGRPLVVAGDLNAVDDHGPLIVMRRNGLRSVTDILGAGWLPTYPAGRTIPPLLPIDHILLDRFLTATTVTRFPVADTDHLGLLATIAGTG